MNPEESKQIMNDENVDHPDVKSAEPTIFELMKQQLVPPPVVSVESTLVPSV